MVEFRIQTFWAKISSVPVVGLRVRVESRVFGLGQIDLKGRIVGLKTDLRICLRFVNVLYYAGENR